MIRNPSPVPENPVQGFLGTESKFVERKFKILPEAACFRTFFRSHIVSIIYFGEHDV